MIITLAIIVPPYKLVSKRKVLLVFYIIITKIKIYLPVVVMFMILHMFLYQVWLHGNEKVTCCAIGNFHLPREVLHTEIYTDERHVCNEQSLKSLKHTHIHTHRAAAAYPW